MILNKKKKILITFRLNDNDGIKFDETAIVGGIVERSCPVFSTSVYCCAENYVRAKIAGDENRSAVISFNCLDDASHVLLSRVMKC